MGEIKPIETRYKGFRFRSRLEARWAVFFDSLGIRWEYELEGFVLPSGDTYLPDFVIRLGAKDVLVEVKPTFVCKGDKELIKAEQAARAGKWVLVLNGPPDANRIWDLYLAREGNRIVATVFRDFGEKYWFLDNSHLSAAVVDPETGNLSLPYDERDIRKNFGKGLLKAVNAARSARFEHGETPVI